MTVTVDDVRHEVNFDEAHLKRTLTLNGVALDLSLLEIDGCRVRFTVDDRPVDALVTGTLPDLVVDVGRGPRSMRVEESRLAEVRRISGLAPRVHTASDLKAPMPGLITRILVAEGDTVAPGTPMLVMEAMKMENELRAPGAGKVKSIKVRSGEAVEVGTVLVTFDTSDVQKPAK
jgi:acetyl/propionyl-CoA carboxylase alpha subunit